MDNNGMEGPFYHEWPDMGCTVDDGLTSAAWNENNECKSFKSKGE